jgi:hypothetical protein
VSFFAVFSEPSKFSHRGYAITLAEFLFYIRAEKILIYKTHPEEIQAVTNILIAAIVEDAPHGNFTVQRFLEASYILRTHGPISSLASFFASECVRLKYALRGAFLLHAGTIASAEEFSKIYINEQRFSAWTNLQSMKRLASTCVENCQQTQIEWVDIGCSMLVDNGKKRVPLNVGMLATMYEDLLSRAKLLLKEMNSDSAFQLCEPWLMSEAVDDNNCKHPGD